MLGFDCCCGGIGFDESAWSKITTCNAGSLEQIENVKNDIALLDECKIVFAGNNATCGNAVRFASGDWPAIKTWIEAGGRMFMVAEHSGDFPGGNTTAKCLQDMPNLNSFLAAIGSSISYIGQDWNESSPSSPPADAGTPGAANIAQGLTTPFEILRFGELSEGSGTTVFLGPTGTANNGAGKTVVAVEKLGDGFFFLSGDSNSIGCEFFKRLWEYDDGQIL